MATKDEKDAAAKKAVETKEQTAARFTKERLLADQQNLQAQAAQAEQMLARAQAAVAQWQGKLQAIVGAHSYCGELLAAYGVEPKPAPNTAPVESKSQQRRKRLQNAPLPNGDASAPSPAPAPAVE